MNGEIRLLHVDDDADFVDLAATFLEREGGTFTVETATSVSEALELLSEEFDGIVSDYDMPDRDGLEFLDRVRETHPDLPFVLFTGQGSEEIASEAISAGVTDYLQKGTGNDQYTVLANRIRNAVEQYRSKRALEASQKRLSLFIEQSPLGVIEYNEAFEIVRLNDAGEVILGYTEEELRGHTWEKIVTEESYENVDSVTDALASGSGGYHSIDENVRKDGERITCEFHNRIVTDDDGDVVAVFSLFRDVTDREERKRRLKRERDRFKTLFENLPVAAVRTTFEDGTPIIRQANPVFEETFGYDTDAIVGTNLDSLVVPEETSPPVEEINRELLETGHVSRQVSRRTADGAREFHAEMVVTSPDDGTPEAYAIYVDITDDIRTRRRLEALLENSPDIIDVHDAEGTILDVNEQFRTQLGYSEAEAIGTKVWEIDRDIDRERAFEIWNELSVDDPMRLETVYERRDGSTFPVEVHLVRLDLLGADRFLVISRDLTARKHRERELERQNERLEEFAEMLSHDLRNPLGVAEGRLELACEEFDSTDLEAVADALARIRSLIEDVRTVARDGETPAEATPVDLAATVERGWRTVETGDATLVVETNRTVLANESQLQQLVENVVRNSVEHGLDDPDPGDVTVTVGDLPGGFYLEDDGVGIPQEVRTDVFEAGYSRKQRGTGLGLSIVEKILDAHGWSIAVTEGTNGGARFEITDVDVLEES